MWRGGKWRLQSLLGIVDLVTISVKIEFLTDMQVHFLVDCLQQFIARLFIVKLGEVERIEQDAYSVVNLMARYDFTKQLYAQLNINNVFDEEYFAMFDAYDQMTYGAPRSATLKMTYKF